MYMGRWLARPLPRHQQKFSYATVQASMKAGFPLMSVSFLNFKAFSKFDGKFFFQPFFLRIS